MLNMNDVPISKRQEYLIIGVFVIIPIVYWWERIRGPGWGDSLMFIVSALEGFSWSVNATGHFLYDNINVVFVRLVPWIEPVTLLTAITILFAFLTLIRIYQTAVILTENSFAAILATIGLAFSFIFWRQAEQVEVYTCSSFFTASAAYYILSDTKSGTYHNIIKSGCWIGLATLVHIQTVLFLPFYLVYIFQALGKNRLKIFLSLIAVLLFFLLLVIPAIVLPDYTLSSIFFGFRFRGEVLNINILSILKGFLLSIAYALYSFHIHIIALTLGFALCLRNSKRVFTLIMTGIIPIWMFAMRYLVSDQYVFFLNAYIFLALLCAYGYDTLSRLIMGEKARAVLLAIVLISSPIVYATSLHIANHITQLHGFQKQKEYKGGLDYYLWPGLRKIPDFFTFYGRQTQTGIPPAIIEQELWDRLSKHTIKYQALMKERK
ncbi:protein O-mannosyl-transferase family [Candidatus Latescibacterota bacterium]